MGFLENLKTGLQNRVREFVLGKAVVDSSMAGWGVPPETFSPEEYASYLTTSNSVYTCATGRADLLATLRPRLYKKTNEAGDRKEVLSGNLKNLLKKVNPYWTFNRLMRMTSLSSGIWGSAFWFLERGESGTEVPREIWWGKSSNVTVLPDETNYIRGFEYETKGVKLFYKPSEVIWFRNPNIIDEFSGLAALASTRLAVDYARDAIRSNRNLFVNGNQLGGVMYPKNRILDKLQAQEIENQIDRRSRGVDKAHRWSFLRMEIEAKQFGVTPKDAEFLGGLKWSLEEVCRAYKWPLDLAGGQRTYENYSAALRAAYTHAVIPEGSFLAEEIVEQLLPMFPGEADDFVFDSSEIEELQEQEGKEWERSQGQIEKGAITINEWRKSKGLEPKPWGDTWWAGIALSPVEELMKKEEPSPNPTSDKKDIGADQPVGEEDNPVGADEETVGEEPKDKETPADEPAGEGERSLAKNIRIIEFGSREHERMWKRYIRKTDPWESKWTAMTTRLFERQKESVVAGLKAGSRSVDVPFDQKEWLKKFRIEARKVLAQVVAEFGEDELEEMGMALAFDVKRPQVIRFMERQAQRFAQQVNETTWEMLRASLADGMDKGEGIDKLSAQVESVMGDRIRSTPETISRTEVNRASNGGKLLAYEQSGVDPKKGWLAALDDRTRDTHLEAHRKYQANPISLDEDFEVGSGAGPAPGDIGVAEEDINCRCTITPVV